MMAMTEIMPAAGTQSWRVHPKRLVPTGNRALSERNPTTHVQSDLLPLRQETTNDQHSSRSGKNCQNGKTHLCFSFSHAVSILEIRRSSVENSVLGDETRYFRVEDGEVAGKGKIGRKCYRSQPR